jgi:hypothetical protein
MTDTGVLPLLAMLPDDRTPEDQGGRQYSVLDDYHKYNIIQTRNAGMMGVWWACRTDVPACSAVSCRVLPASPRRTGSVHAAVCGSLLLSAMYNLLGPF